MDDRGCRKWCELPRKTLHFVALLSFFSFLYSSSYNLHLSTFLFSLFAHAVDRNYVFLVCNLILAFLVKNLTFSSAHQHTLNQMPAILLSPNAPECTCHPLHHHNLQEHDHDQEEEEDDLKEDQDEDQAQAQADASVSTEELNQKFEEFIRKMKEEIRIEAQHQQPIPVSNHSLS